MTIIRNSRLRGAVVTAGVASVLLTACGPSGDELATRRADMRACAEPTAARLGQAGVQRYIAARNPKPVRFLNPISTDSAVPASAMAYLNATGPTYLFPPAEEQQAIVRAKLTEAGSWTTLLVAFHGVERVSEREAEIRFSGAYVGGAEDGDAAPREAVRFVCSGGEWALPTAPSADSSAVPVPRGA